MKYSLPEVMAELSELGDEKRRAYHKKIGVNDNQYGVNLGKLRAFAKRIGKNHPLAQDLWKSQNYEAMILAAMVFDKTLITKRDFEGLLRDAYIPKLVDELTFQTLAYSPFAKMYMWEWIDCEDEIHGRGGWNLAISLLNQRQMSQQDLERLFKKIELNRDRAVFYKQQAINRWITEIGNFRGF